MKPGQSLGQYRIESQLGQGGMGVVYRALDTKLNRPVAVKFLSAEIADAVARRRFQREAQMASALNHPHIVTVYDAGEWEGRQYVVTEFVDGGTLSNWAAAKPRSWREIVELLTGVAEGLAAAHEARILHRDIKPANILVSQSGYAKLADFGLARLADPPGSDDQTRTGTGVIVGTTAYMSPEQAKGLECDARSDIFSLGVVLYEMLAGRRPFEGRSSPETLQKIVHEPPPPLSDKIPASLRDLVEKALEKEPQDRYQSVREMVVDLRRIARRTESAAPAASSRQQSHWWIAAASLLLVVLLVAVTVGILFRPTPTNERSERLQIEPPPGGRFILGSIATVGGIAVSPDGRSLAFVATVNERSLLWIRPFDGIARPIEKTDGAQRPFWSPDSKSVAVFAQEGLLRVDAAGGVPVLVARQSTDFPMSGSWSEDGTILFWSGSSGIMRVPASGGEPKSLGVPGGFPQALPGGAFLYWQPDGDAPGIYAATLADPANSKLLLPSAVHAIYASGYLLWRNGTALMAQPFDPANLKLSGEPRVLLSPVAVGQLDEPIFTASTTGRLIYDAEGNDKDLRWYGRTGQRLDALGPHGSYQGFRLFDNARRVMIQANAAGDRGLWLIDEDGRKTLIESDVSVNPTPSPDGKSVIFSVPGPGLFRADISGENRKPLKTSDAMDFRFPLDWSGDVLLYAAPTPATRMDIWYIRVSPDGTPAPGATPQLYLQTPAMENAARYAPGQNQRWLAYHSDESGRAQIYIQSFPTKGEKLPVSKQGGTYPVWGPGGGELFYTSPDNKIMVVDVKFGSSSASVSTPRELFPLPPNSAFLPTSPFETIDGQRFLILSGVAPATRPLQMITNWPAMLKQ